MRPFFAKKSWIGVAFILAITGLAASVPAAVAPRIRLRIDHLARTVHVVRLTAGGGIRYAQAIRKNELIPRACARAVGHKLMPAVVLRPHIKVCRAIQLDLDLAVRRSPEPKANGAVGLQLRSERHGMGSPRINMFDFQHRDGGSNRDSDPNGPGRADG